MKNDCKLIATLPSLGNIHNVTTILKNEFISEARFNTGVRSPYTPFDTLNKLVQMANYYKKILWLDIKGRQLRVNAWADPLYECVELNHSINVKLPAKMAFRNGTTVDISVIKGNKVFLANPPREALGKGQSVNIIGNTPDILDRYLTPQDIAYLEICNKLNIKNIMASFVERPEDLEEIISIVGKDGINICSKIESSRGLGFIIGDKISNQLMAARDDLYIELESNYKLMMEALKLIITYNPNAICASRIFTSLEKRETPALSDYEDLEMMYQMGYRRFMFCDNVCNYAFDKAIRAWEVFINA